MEKRKVVLYISHVGIWISFAALVFVGFHAFDTSTRMIIGALAGGAGGTKGEGLYAFLSGTADRANLIQRGNAVISEAGYAYSFSGYCLLDLMRQIAPALVIFLLLICLNGVLRRREEKDALEAYTTLSQKCRDQEKEIAALYDELRANINKTTEYEENLYHQLKTPLTSLGLCAEILAADAKIGAVYGQEMRELSLQVRKLSRLVTMFLRDAELSENRAKFQYALTDLDILIGEAVQDVAFEAECKKVVIDWTAPDDSIFIYCDEKWLLECLVTLLGNAVDAVPKGGRVRLTLHKKDAKAVLFILSEGTFLDLTKKEQLFTRYYSTKEGHFGIGLHMAESIAESHHGHITADNVKDTGALFTVNLPILHGAEAYE